MWYRIELNKDGSIRSCAEVEACATEGRNVRYVEADSRKDALVLVAAWWRRAETMRRNNQARITDCKKRGICVHCRSRPAEGDWRCGVCRQAQRDSADRSRRRARGEDIPRLVSHAKTDEARAASVLRDRETRARRLVRQYSRDWRMGGNLAIRTLSRVLASYDSNPDGFRAWLVSEIDRLRAQAMYTEAAE